MSKRATKRIERIRNLLVDTEPIICPERAEI